MSREWGGLLEEPFRLWLGVSQVRLMSPDLGRKTRGAELGAVPWLLLLRRQLQMESSASPPAHFSFASSQRNHSLKVSAGSGAVGAA